MKKEDRYHTLNENFRSQVLQEPEVIYQAKLQVEEDYPTITQRELDENCMTLDEFIQRLERKVHKHFHP